MLADSDFQVLKDQISENFTSYALVLSQDVNRLTIIWPEGQKPANIKQGPARFTWVFYSFITKLDYLNLTNTEPMDH